MTTTMYRSFWTLDLIKGCQIWHGATAKGRPKVKLAGKMEYVSRLVLEAKSGPPPTDKHEACHIVECNNPLCVNDDHLYWGTHQQNMMDVPEGVRKASSAKANKARLSK